MTPEEALKLNGEARLSLHLATSVDDRPHVAPVWYVLHHDHLWITTAGKKLGNIRRNPRVACSFEKYDEDGVDWGVQVLGTSQRRGGRGGGTGGASAA